MIIILINRLNLFIYLILICLTLSCARSPSIDIVHPFFTKGAKISEYWFVSLAKYTKRDTNVFNDQPYENDLIFFYKQANKLTTNKEENQHAQYARDRFIFSIFSIVEEYQERYIIHLRGGRATTNFVFDLIILSLNSVGTVISGETVKTALHAAAAGLEGVNLSFDLNYFNKLTTEIIINQIESSRTKKKTEIYCKIRTSDNQKCKAKTIIEYTIQEAENDLLEYFYSASIAKALTDLQKESANEVDKAETKLREIQGIKHLYDAQTVPTDQTNGNGGG